MIDLTKKYQTRSGLPVRIYAVDGGGICPVHGAIKDDGGWYDDRWRADGSYTDSGAGDSRSLVIAKSWRAWDASRDMVPKRLMTKTKNALGGQCTDGITLVYPGSLQFIFDNFVWLHEDGSETPCGVCE
jgi:hypothetical protein